MEDDSRMCKEGYYTSPSKMEFEDVLEGCSWDGTFSEPLDSGYNTAVPSTTPSLAEDSYFLASLEKLRQMLESSVPSVSEASRQFAGTGLFISFDTVGPVCRSGSPFRSVKNHFAERFDFQMRSVDWFVACRQCSRWTLSRNVGGFIWRFSLLFSDTFASSSS